MNVPGLSCKFRVPLLLTLITAPLFMEMPCPSDVVSVPAPWMSSVPPFMEGQAQDPPPQETVRVALLPTVVVPEPPSAPQPDQAIVWFTVRVWLVAEFSVPPLRVRAPVEPVTFRFSVPPVTVVASGA